MKVTYTIRKILGGLLYYAEIELKIYKGSNDLKFIDSCQGEGWVRQGHIEDASKEGYQDWKDGAKKGIISALQIAKMSKTVELLRISGTCIDTNKDVVEVAAKLAALKALGCKVTEDQEFAWIQSLKGSFESQK